MPGRPPDDELLHFLQQHNQPLTHLSPGGTYHPNPLPLDADELAAIEKRKQIFQFAQSLNPRPWPAAPMGPQPNYDLQPAVQYGALAAALQHLK